MRTHLTFALCTGLFVFASGADGAVAEDFQTKIVGGQGGAPFELNCPNGGSLVGLYLRFSGWIEQLDAICVGTSDGRWSSSPQRVMSNGYNAPVPGKRTQWGYAIGGSGGGTETTIVCSRDSVVYALNVETTVPPGGAMDMVGRAEIHCVNPKTGSEDVVTPIPRPEGSEYVARWPADCRSQSGRYWASGVVGRAGVYIDALGLRCASPLAPVRAPRKEQIETPTTGARLTPRPGPSLPPAAPKYLPPPEVLKTATGATYTTPMIEDETGKLGNLDWCLNWGSGCGKAAADAFCKFKGHGLADKFTKVDRLGHSVVLTDRKVCAQPHCDAFAAIACRASATEAPPKSAGGSRFDWPMTAGGERLHACMYLPQSQCGWAPADAFCQNEGFRTVADFDVKRGKIRSETWLGDLCTKGKCRVFTQITCTK
jgi:hypothetical protein